MSSLRFSDAVTALLAAYASAPALTGVTVTDGPNPTASADPDFIIAGHAGNLDPDGSLATATTAGNLTQGWLQFPVTRQETGHVNCAAVSQSGDAAGIPGCRARAQVLVGACEDAALSAGDVGGILFEGTETAVVSYRQSGQGCAVIVAFTVGYTTQW